jgi:predicted DNA-binding ribbon-helix-helix protein
VLVLRETRYEIPSRYPLHQIRGHKTSVSLEDAFWNCLKEIAKERRQSLPRLVADIDAERKSANLSSNLRVFVLGYYQDKFNPDSTHADLRAFDQAALGLG